jgi:hypothetical protein
VWDGATLAVLSCTFEENDVGIRVAETDEVTITNCQLRETPVTECIAWEVHIS